jgi:rhodanese-related sulfurtransferase
LNEIPTNKTIYIYCEAGLRGYLAQRILRQNGFNNVFNLSGGYHTWRDCTAETNMLQ